MMKQVTFEAPRSTAATTGARTRAAFSPSLRSTVLATPVFASGCALRLSAFPTEGSPSALPEGASARLASFSIGRVIRLVWRSGLGARGGGRLLCGRRGPSRGSWARPHGDHVGVAQVDALEAELQDAR